MTISVLQYLNVFSCLVPHLKSVLLWFSKGVHSQLARLTFLEIRPHGVVSVRNEWCWAIPASIFSFCPNKKHIYKYSFTLHGMYGNPIHFGQSICSEYTLRLWRGTKGPLWPLAGEKPQADEWLCTQHSLRGLVRLAELHYWARPAWENRSVKKWKYIWFDFMGLY